MKKVLKNVKEMSTNEVGITLIALVVTIVVLLILAATSISMLSGDNGILQKATKAKTRTERQSIVEQARTDVLGYQAENRGGDLEKSQLKSVLETYFEDVPDFTDMSNKEILEKQLETLSKYGTYTITVSEIYNGDFSSDDSSTNEPGATKIATSAKALAINGKIGQMVSGYTANNISNWQVFYATDNEVFIISCDIAQSSFIIPETGVGKTDAYSGIGDVRSSNYNYGKNWNSKWIEICESAPVSFDETNTTSSAKMVAYMCDSDNWTSYVSAPANYAVGGPTYELLVTSIASNGGTNEIDNISADSNGYKLIESLANINSLASPYKDTRNYPGYWIASPDGELRYSTNLWVASTHLFADYYSLDGATPGIRPLVSIPISKINESTLVISSN